jgi:hypothetical protein
LIRHIDRTQKAIFLSELQLPLCDGGYTALKNYLPENQNFERLTPLHRLQRGSERERPPKIKVFSTLARCRAAGYLCEMD